MKWVLLFIIFLVPLSSTAIWNIELMDIDPLLPLGDEIVVAVIDTGLDLNHPDFQDKLWNNTDEISSNGMDDDNNGYIDDIFGWDFENDDNDPSDDNIVTHGTHVSGSLISDHVGLAPDAILMPLKAFDVNGDADFDTVAESIVYATDNGAHIISMSLGGPTGSTSLRNAVLYAYQKGVIMVAATGNDGSGSIDYPAKYDQVIAVGSIDQNKLKSSFSNYGPELDVVAPGEEVNSTVGVGTGLTSMLNYEGSEIESVPMQYSLSSVPTEITLVDGGTGTLGEISSATDKIVLIERGGLSFAEMADNAKVAGAKGILVYNTINDTFAGSLQTNRNMIAVSISKTDGLAFKNDIANGETNITLEISSSNYFFNSGTSMAVPHITGLLSLLLSQKPGLTLEEIRRFLKFGSEDLGLKGYDDAFGWGLPKGGLLRDVIDDSRPPSLTYKLWNFFNFSDGKIEFDLQINASDDVGIYEIEYSYSNSTQRFENIGTGNVSISVPIEIEVFQDEITIHIVVLDPIGNNITQSISYTRDTGEINSTSETPDPTTPQPSIITSTQRRATVPHIFIAVITYTILYMKRRYHIT